MGMRHERTKHSRTNRTRPNKTTLQKTQQKIHNHHSIGQLLLSLIKTKHNSNHKKMQVTLIGEPIEFFFFAFVGIVPFKILKLTKHQQKGRFIELNKEQTQKSYEYIQTNK
jgi:hypothetical protein